MLTFKPYEAKPVTRMAAVITSDWQVKQVEGVESTYEYCGVRFKAYQEPVTGDYIVRLTDEDTYHCTKAVFHERNVVE